MNLTADAQRNQTFWDDNSESYQQWYDRTELDDSKLFWNWPTYHEDDLRVLGDVAGKDVLELGCGGAQWSILLAKRGARTVGLDISAKQLEFARTLMVAHGVDFPLVHSGAESVPLPDASFDIVFAEYGALSWSDPLLTVPEAARLLRTGGLLAFMTNSPLIDLCWATEEELIGDRLQRDYFGMHRLDLGDHVEYQLPYGEWIRLFRRDGFVIEDLIELQTPEAPTVGTYRTDDEHAWGRRWPAMNIWKVRKER